MSIRSILSLLLVSLAWISTDAWMPVHRTPGAVTTTAAATSWRHDSSSRMKQLPALSSTSSVETNIVAVADEESETPTKLSSPETSKSGDLELELKDKVINAVFLSAAFGYALYTIFSIDSGLTRGWTAQEIAMRIPLDNWGAYESYLANKPVVTKTLINVIIYLLGDWLSQTAFQGKNVLEFDIKRTLRNGFIGLCFGPLVHEYYQFSDTILPPENGIVTRLEKIAMDQTIYLSVKCSIYISAVGLLGGDDVETVKQTVKDKIVGILFTAWKFWPLVHCITYGLIPARHRILWVNSVDLVWNAILATKAQKETPSEAVEAEDIVQALAAVTQESEDDNNNNNNKRNNETTFYLEGEQGDDWVVDMDDSSTTYGVHNSTAIPVAG